MAITEAGLETRASISIERIKRARISVPIIGTAPLIAHRWDEKAKQMMLESMQTRTRKKKDAKDPVAEFNRARYIMGEGRDGFPAVGFKAAMVDAARLYDGVKMTELRAALIVIGIGSDQLIEIEAEPPRMREDTVRVNMGGADLRYRPEYSPWKATLEVAYIPSMISATSVVAIVDAAGVGGVDGHRGKRGYRAGDG